MDIAGYLASIFIGISLGLIGGGGSILTVPVLVYLFHIDAFLATSYSLFIVGTTSVAGSISFFKKKLVDTKVAIMFGVPSVLAVFLTRKFIVPAIPQQVFSIEGFEVSKNLLLLLLFAILMVVASYSMIKGRNGASGNNAATTASNYWLIVIQGVFIGAIISLVGAGGGFLIIPVLVNLLKVPMKTAIGTSLVIISINSLLGFLFSLSYLIVQWKFIISISAIAVVGILIGSYLSTKIEGKKLKTGFGWFVLAMGIYIIVKEILLK